MSEEPQGEAQEQPTPEQPPAQGEGQPPGEAVPKEAKTFGMLCHLGALAGFIGIPFGNIIGPLVFWLVKKKDYPFVDDQGKESLNFQITVTIAAVALFLIALTIILIPLVIFLAIALTIFDVVMIIMAAIKANDGVSYRYPVCIRFIK